jgi:hypothetical protein
MLIHLEDLRCNLHTASTTGTLMDVYINSVHNHFVQTATAGRGDGNFCSPSVKKTALGDIFFLASTLFVCRSHFLMPLCRKFSRERQDLCTALLPV